MDDKRALLHHFLVALAYRTQKALRGAPPGFASVLGYSRTFFTGGFYQPPEFPDFESAIAHFHETLADVARHLEQGTPLATIHTRNSTGGTFFRRHAQAGQLALLQRLAGNHVPPENFIYAAIDNTNLGPNQPLSARPDELWPEKP